MKRLLQLFIFLGALGATPSQACPFAGAQRPILRNSIPLFPGGGSILGVHVLRYRDGPGSAVEARVTHVTKGPPGISAVTIVSTSSCDALPRPGEVGVVIGTLSRTRDGIYALLPKSEPSFSDRVEARRRLLTQTGIVLGLLLGGWLLWSRVLGQALSHRS